MIGPSFITAAGTSINALNHGLFTVKRRKKSSGALNQRKMFEEVSSSNHNTVIKKNVFLLIFLPIFQAQMVRRVKAYLSRMKVITDEDKLHELSLQCENNVTGGGGGSGSSSTAPQPIRKCNPSPTLSTASSASSTSEGRRTMAPKFGKH